MQRGSQRGVGAHQLLDGPRIRAVHAQRAEALGMLVVAVDPESACHARALGQARQIRGLRDGVFGHVPIRSPLAARGREQTRRVDVDGVIARQRCRQPAVAALDQRPDADEDAEHVGTRRRLVQVPARGLEDEVDLPVERPWLEGGRVDRRVGRTDQRVLVPRDGEHHAPVARVRHHDRAVARQERPIEHEMDALARRDQRRRVRLGEMADAVTERAGGVDHHRRVDLERVTGFEIASHETVNEAVDALRDAGDLRVVEQRRALLGRGLHEVDQQPRIVELAVVIDHPAAQALGLDRRQALQRLVTREDFRGAETVLPGQHVVDLESDPVERRFPPVVVGDDEGQVAHQVRRVLPQDAPFLQRLHHERDVALLEIAHAPVHQLRTATRRALAEVVLLEQQHLVAARGGIDGDPDSSGAAADDREVARAVHGPQPRQHPAARHDRCAPTDAAGTGRGCR